MASKQEDETSTESEPLRTPLYDLHIAHGGRMVSFAGYALPVQYRGIIVEHEQARTKAALFDVSHMGQARIAGPKSVEALESLVPADIASLSTGQMQYTQLTNETGGILDDLMVTRLGRDALLIVVNAACKAQDFRHIARALEPYGSALSIDESSALLALQGPKAGAVMATIDPRIDMLTFMHAGSFEWNGAPLWISRSGYTGEDGFEMSIPTDRAMEFAERLLSDERVALSGLGARNSLRLEAGLCLYGHDIDTEATPVEANLSWSIGKRRRDEGGFPGADIILKQLKEGPPRRRVGLKPKGRAPAREGTDIQDADGKAVGAVTSGGFGPTVSGPVAMGYVAAELAEPGTVISLMVRGKPIPATVEKLPFITPGYKR